MSSNKPLCIYHGNCADGFTAAWAIWKRFGDTFEYYPGIYQNPPPDVTGRDVVMVDFSFKREVVRNMRGWGPGKARSVLILDHHKSAAADLGEQDGNFCIDIGKWTGGLSWERHMSNAIQDDMENVSDSVYCLFDMDRSGASIAWDFFHPGTPQPAIVRYVEDRDLWRFNLDWSREISAALFSQPYDFAIWDQFANRMGDGSGSSFDRLVDQGAAIEGKHHKDVAELVAALRREMIIGGHWVPVANLPYTLTSDAGHLMCKPYQSPNLHGEIVTPYFAACYWDTADGRVFSLRSDGDFDVAEVAKQYGGGGHKNASGFRVSYDRLSPDGSPRPPL